MAVHAWRPARMVQELEKSFFQVPEATPLGRFPVVNLECLHLPMRVSYSSEAAFTGSSGSITASMALHGRSPFIGRQLTSSWSIWTHRNDPLGQRQPGWPCLPRCWQNALHNPCPDIHGIALERFIPSGTFTGIARLGPCRPAPVGSSGRLQK